MEFLTLATSLTSGGRAPSRRVYHVLLIHQFEVCIRCIRISIPLTSLQPTPTLGLIAGGKSATAASCCEQCGVRFDCAGACSALLRARAYFCSNIKYGTSSNGLFITTVYCTSTCTQLPDECPPLPASCRDARD